MKQKLLSTMFAVACIASSSYAQERQVSGKVTAANGSPIGGVSISVVGTSTATQTDASGSFTLSAAPGATISASSIGYITQRVSVGNSSIISIVLQADDTELEEVVVVGYGSTTKEAFTGSAKKVDGANLQQKNVSNISQAIAGEVAGLQVVNGSGQPGTAATVRIRGFGSVNGNRDPLYVVDGVPYSGNLTSINNSDIASVTVLKDATATAIYGSRGANGVIVITTKNGRGQESFIEADVNVGSNMALLPRYDVIKSPEQYAGLAWEGLYNYAQIIGGYTNEQATTYANGQIVSAGAGKLNIWNVTNGSELIDPATRTVLSSATRKFDPENWEDYAFQNSTRTDVNVKFGGSSDKTNYFTSYGYLGDKGYSINSDFERFSARVNIDHKVKPWLNVGLNLNLSKSERNNNGQSEDSGSIFWFVDNIPSIYPLFTRNADGSKIENTIYGGYEFDYGQNRRFGALTNSIADATYGVDRHNRSELNGRGYLNFNIVDGLTFENSFGYQYYNNNYVSKNDKFFGSAASTNGSLYKNNSEMNFYNILNLLRYKKSFASHNFEALVAHESSEFKVQNTILSGNQLVDPYSLDFNNVIVTNPNSGYTNSYALESFFGQVNYDYDGKYLLSGSVRRDGSSRFLNNKWGTFGAIGAGWVVSNEEFMNIDAIDFLKLKASYGVIGDQGGVGYYPGYDKFNIVNVNDKPAFSFDTKGNPDLTWETSKMFQTGVEFRLGNYLTGNVEYYLKNTSNLIFDRRIGPSIGFAMVRVNDGNLRNQGLEFDLTGHILKNSDYYLDLSIIGETFKNKITKMPIDPSTELPKILDIQGNYGWAEGHSIYDFYIRDFAGVDPNDGRSTWKVFYTDNNANGQFDAGEQIASLNQFENPNQDEIKEGTTKTYSQATQFYTGKSAVPKLRGALNLRAGYKNFDLSVQMLYSFGGYAYDAAYAGLMGNGTVGGNNWHSDILNRWQKPGDITDVPRISNNATTDQNVSSSSTRFLTKANYLSLNNIRLGYNFDKSLVSVMGLKNLGVWVSADNLWYKSARKGFYPSTAEAGNSNMYRYSPLSTISAGLRAKF
ncbi:SusC/RagA family TonB-linked outer membrane protein [Sphingobacterium bovisgrunnientis]|uniref:SusC/RagA family TonB-linked outer membrane protein n=1 Tax=Sphingobacterium bovisgrunnientis TaxID=1874697 RepID=UPI0013569D77|nr:SusC/RagA family TonB-linked outer membrane protein [Sphingobacterium bovisgrunnientis]